MPITLNGDTGIVTPMYNGSITANAVTPSVNMKNRIINGAMVIDQRNAGASFTPTTTTYYGTCDRWAFYVSQNSKLTAQQSTTVPAGFKNSLIVTSSSAYTVLSGDYFTLSQAIEGLNVSDLDWGTANAKTVTLSFWVRSSLTGTFGGTIQNSAQNRSYPFSYTISSANTWEQKSITIAGDTSGTWLTTNGVGIGLQFGLGVGSSSSGTANAWTGSNVLAPTGATSVVGTNGATFYITGVQLEVGSTATSFDYRPYGTELVLCQRYYEKRSFTNNDSFCMAIANASSGNTQIIGVLDLLVEKRTAPTATTSAASTFGFGWLGGSVTGNSILVAVGTLTTGTLALGLGSGASQIAGYFSGASSFIAFNSEL